MNCNTQKSFLCFKSRAISMHLHLGTNSLHVEGQTLPLTNLSLTSLLFVKLFLFTETENKQI